jgi:Ca2+-binding EF-hand superfamily protein
VVPQPRCWFSWLDADHDGQLSLAELRGAWARLADAGAEKRGYLTLPDTKAMHYSLTLMPGDVGSHGVRLRRPEKRAGRGPAWFVAMDRNGDGFVSRAEWLGSAKDFDRLDRDGDGLISPAEAEAAGVKK